MNPSDYLQLFGSVAIALFALGIYRVALSPNWFSSYGKEALLCAASYLVTVVVMRMLALGGILTQEEARIINGLVAWGFLAIMVQIIHLHWFSQRFFGGR